MPRILCFALCFLLLSAVAVQAEEFKFGVFDVQKVAAESDALKMAKEDVDKRFGKQRTDLEKERDDIEKKAESFKKKAPTEKQQKALQKQHREYQEKTQAFMKILQAEEMRIRQGLEKAITQAAKAVAVKNGYLLILDKAAAPYFDPRQDVTSEILMEVNNITKAAAQPPAAGK
jgi:outer membrane protein